VTAPTGRATAKWLAPGDVNGFLALALDNVTNLVILSTLLIGVFRFPPDLVLFRMVPGTALGVLVGDLAYTWLAVRLQRATGRADVTAMPFGIDTPTLFAMVFAVLGPVMVATGDPMLAWKVGMAVTIAIGVVKVGLSFAGEAIRRAVPRAALLGSIAGVALLLIAFLPALKVFADPLVGFVALVVVLVALVARAPMPWALPGALVAVAAATAIYWARAWLVGADAMHAVAPLRLAMPWPTLAWLDAWGAALPYLAIAVPFALITTIGGIDNAESAAAAGDDYRTRDILLTEALATVIAGACGGVVQNTPYIGHPAYKAMGARAGYTLATGLFVGAGAAVGIMAWVVALLPEAAVAPILVFIGLEITAQAFHASPARHAAAVAVAFLPVAANLVLIELGSLGRPIAELAGSAAEMHQTLLLLGNGFIVTALVWASAVALLIDGRAALAGAALAAGSLATLFGIMHSPVPTGAVFWPWAAPSPLPFRLAGAYGVAASILWLLSSRSRGVAPLGERER
jgi:AGZA family xanthine/uracil permease-like MFS transporter